MSLYRDWLKLAYDKNGKSIRKFWDGYMPREQKIYEAMLAGKDPVISGTVAELAERHNMPAPWIIGYLDGLREALDEEPDMEAMEAGTAVNARVDFERLYKKMVQFKAEHLMNLPQWDAVFDEARRAEMFREQKESGTQRRETPKVGRNDPCPCGSGRKYKQCCGA